MGTHGEGPGELSGDVAVLYRDHTDSLHVVDQDNRWTVFSPELTVARQATGIGALLANIYGTTFLPSGRIAIAHPLPSIADRRPIHIIDRTGSVLQSFGEAPPSLRQTDGHSILNTAAAVDVSAGATFWTVTQSSYRLELWDAQGNRLRHLDRVAPWFKRLDLGTAVLPGGTLLPNRVIALRSDSVGLIWTVIMIPVASQQSKAGPMLGLDDIDRYYDFRAEVLDPISMVVWASQHYAA
jgi:hypothetical protein